MLIGVRARGLVVVLVGTRRWFWGRRGGLGGGRVLRRGRLWLGLSLLLVWVGGLFDVVLLDGWKDAADDEDWVDEESTITVPFFSFPSP